MSINLFECRTLTRRFFYPRLAKAVFNVVLLYEQLGIRSEEIRRIIGNPEDKFYNFHLDTMRQCNILTQSCKNNNSKSGYKEPIRLTEQARDAYNENKNLLVVPNISDARNEKVRNRRLINFLLSTLPDVNFSNRWDRSTRYGCFFSLEEKVDNRRYTESIKEITGLSLIDLVSQQDLENYEGYNSSKSTFAKEEIERRITRLKNISHGSFLLKPIKIHDDIRRHENDQILYDLLTKCQSFLIHLKYNAEYYTRNCVINKPHDRKKFDSLLSPEFQWYRSIFGKREFETLIDTAYDTYCTNFSKYNIYDRLNSWKSCSTLFDRYMKEIHEAIFNILYIKEYKKALKEYGFLIDPIARILLSSITTGSFED